MPTYEYVCEKCGHTFEKFQSITEKALTVCPKDLCHCKKWGKGKVKRVIGAGAGLIFKGSGFYITDYRSENYKAGAKKDTPPAKTEKPSSSTSSSSGSTPSSSGSNSKKS